MFVADGAWAGRPATARPRPSSRDGDLVNLISGVTGTLVDALDSIGAGTVRKTEDVTSPGVGPRLLECDALVVLYVDVRLVGGFQRVRGDSHHAGMHIHELRHNFIPLNSLGEGQPRPDLWFMASRVVATLSIVPVRHKSGEAHPPLRTPLRQQTFSGFSDEQLGPYSPVQVLG